MNKTFYDPIIAEVRKNREAMLAEFDGDTKKLTAYLDSKWSDWEAIGFRYETPEAREIRLEEKRQHMVVF